MTPGSVNWAFKKSVQLPAIYDKGTVNMFTGDTVVRLQIECTPGGWHHVMMLAISVTLPCLIYRTCVFKSCCGQPLLVTGEF
jgi:hypothetical protein